MRCFRCRSLRRTWSIFMLAMVVFFAYLFFYIHLFLGGRGILVTALWLPLLIVMQCLLITGITCFVSCMNVFYEDTKYMLIGSS